MHVRTKIVTNVPIYVVHVEVVFSLTKRTRLCDRVYMHDCMHILACVRDHICDLCMYKSDVICLERTDGWTDLRTDGLTGARTVRPSYS